MEDLFKPLDIDQERLVRFLFTTYVRNGGRWATWHYVVTELGRQGLDAEAVIRSLPMVGVRQGAGDSYCAVWYDRMLHDESRPELTVAAALHLPELEQAWAEPFLRYLRLLVDMQWNAPASPDEVREAPFNPGDVKAQFPWATEVDLGQIPDLLRHEPPTRRIIFSEGEDNRANWRGRLDRNVLKFRDINDVKAYVEKVIEVFFPDHETFEDPAPVVLAAAVAGNYIDPVIISDLETKADDGSTEWKVDKLLQILRELNDNHASGHPYASLALLRAILDHVPPVFGDDRFNKVVNNHSWGQTDAGYLKKLAEIRNPADDVMHRHIRKSNGVITMDDLPHRSAVNGFLRIVIDTM